MSEDTKKATATALRRIVEYPRLPARGDADVDGWMRGWNDALTEARAALSPPADAPRDAPTPFPLPWTPDRSRPCAHDYTVEICRTCGEWVRDTRPMSPLERRDAGTPAVCKCGHDAGSHDYTVGYCRARRPSGSCGCKHFTKPEPGNGVFCDHRGDECSRCGWVRADAHAGTKEDET